MLNIGVFGAGHLGKIHLKLLNESKEYNLIGFHDSDIINVKQILKDFNLEFLGFFLDDHTKKEFFKKFSNNKKNSSLDNWHQFEINNPNIFMRMYQFWVRKL